VSTRENLSYVYCFATNQKRNETAEDNRQTAAWISHDLIRNNELVFLPQQIFSFTVFKSTEIVLFVFQLIYVQRIDMNDTVCLVTLRESDVESSR